MIQVKSSLDLFLIIRTVVGSILEVFFLCLVGYILARKGIISSQSKTTLNKINVAFFTPSLMFSKVAFSLTIEKLTELWIVPIGFILITSISALVAFLLSRYMFRLSKPDTKFCLAVSMFMNSNSLPIALVTSLISNLQGTNGLDWGPDDSKDKQLGRSITYLVVFSTLGLILRWSYGVSLLSASTDTNSPRHRSNPDSESTGLLEAQSESESELDEDNIQPQPNSRESTPLEPESDNESINELFVPRKVLPPISPSSTVSFANPTTDHRIKIQHPRRRRSTSDANHLRRPIFQSFPNVAIKWVESLASSSSISSGSTIESEQQQQQPVRRRQRWFKRFLTRPLYRIHQFMTPPLYASLLSIVVVCIPPLQDWLEKLGPLRSALKSAGNVSVPLTLVVLGAYFHSDTSSSPPNSTSRTQGSNKTILASILSRQIITPIILIPSLSIILKWMGIDGEGVHEDPCFVIVSVLLVGAPPAITLAQMTTTNSFKVDTKLWKLQEFNNSRFRELVSKTLLISYVFITPISTVILVVMGVLVLKAVQ
ncbi:hypothetical protein CROQUDRAFT_659863 [Cronartium quercuum f. sp. fusiforme G11]|uniref:PIN-like protein n=1 Tax=Cronartium quercuum f. sp. fusiforme G11 TaxID=708437 RepID=A0A9P6NEM0_9BASI|nr:hypothetical protein CROQUDRAFT_659863 [Cronartium quercuum f. sp. fusiforme G11]